jgi:hypothetical protein
MSVRRWILPVVLIGLGVAGCAQQGTNGSGSSASSTASAPSGQGGAGALPLSVTITRTGGLAGVNQSIEINADGTWMYSDHRQAKNQNGRLTPDQLEQLRRLVTDPAFAAQLSRPTPTDVVCNDAFEYTVSVGGKSVAFSDCGDSPPAVAAAISMVEEATPF